jgi:hypothetical protein
VALGVAVTVKKKVYGVASVLLLMFSAAAGFLLADLATANIVPPVILPAITINSDGSISPQTELISRNGNTYALTADIQEYPIVIACSNIIFDGAGHTINITTGDNAGLTLRDVNSVTVKNIKVFSRNSYTIDLHFSYSCLITGVQTGWSVRVIGNSNNITESNTGIYISKGGNNLITRNNISNIFVASSSNMFFKNNFYLTAYPLVIGSVGNYWDNGSVGNYWSNYTMRYPNATEIGHTGIGNTPYALYNVTGIQYVMTEDNSSKAINIYVIAVNNVDHHPLMYPYDIENDTMALPAREPLPEPESFPTALVIAASGASIAIIGIGLMVYFRKRNHAITNKHSETAQSTS